MTDLEKWERDWDNLAKRDLYGSILSMGVEYSEEQFVESGRATWAKIQPHLPTPCDRIVDIGCGAGRILQFARESCSEAIGVDISSEMLAAARNRLGDNGYRYLKSTGGIESSSVDFIYTVGVFKHLTIEMVDEYLREGSRILRPGGVYFISYYARRPEQFPEWVDETDAHSDRQHPRTNRVIPREVMGSMLKEKGLEIDELTDWLAVARA